MSRPIQLVVLISGSGSNLQAIIDNINRQTLDAKINAVVSDQLTAFGLERAQKANIATEVIRYDGAKKESEGRLIQLIEQYHPDLIVLAGFMRILSASFVNHFAGKIINIHPSLLPKFKGLNTHQRAIDAGETRHGATVHFVTADLDSGPIIIQSSVPIDASDNATSLQKKVLEREHVIYSQAIQWLQQGKVSIDDQSAAKIDPAV